MSSLPKNASLSILILNNVLPNDQREFWVSAREIRDRLVHCGVMRKLTEEHVVHAKTYCDKDGIFLHRRKDRNVSYFRSPQFEGKCPDEQRWKDSGLPIRTVITKAIMPPKLLNYFDQHKPAQYNLSILNEALEKIQSTPKNNNNKQQQKKKRKGEGEGSNNTNSDDATLGNALSNSNTTTDDMAVDTPQPLIRKKILPPSQRWDASMGNISNVNHSSTASGVKRHGEPLEKSNDENELPPDGQLWVQRQDPSYYYRTPWAPPPPMMPFAATYIPQPTATTATMQHLYWKPRHHDTSFAVDEPPLTSYTNSYLQYSQWQPTQARVPPSQTTRTSTATANGGLRITNYSALPRMTPAIAEAMIEMGSERQDFGMDMPTINEEEESVGVENDSFKFVRTSLHQEFIKEIAVHASICRVCPQPHDDGKSKDNNEEEWECPRCGKILNFRSCKWTKSDVVARGRKYARSQPEVNLRVVQSARENGVNIKQANDFLEGIGVPCITYRNTLHNESKIREAIASLSEERLEENLREHCEAARGMENYKGDIVWTDKDGKVHHTCRGAGCMDGAGLTRSYNHRNKGSQAAFIVWSLVINKPIMVIHHQVKCILCTRSFNKANRSERVPLENTSRAMKHTGRCYRNSLYGPSISEEYAAGEAARSLLLDNKGNYRGDDSAVFIDVVVSDNDVNAPTNFIKEQHDIIGSPADGLAEHIPDIGHVIKDCNNELYRIREKNNSFRGVNLLENSRIRDVMADVLTAFLEYKPHIPNDKARLKCLKRIKAVITHHCGDHSKCEWEDVCSFVAIKNKNPTWSLDEIHKERAKQGRFNGKSMGLSRHGIHVLQRVLFKRFDARSVDRVSKCLSSNPAEAYFGMIVKFSQGKRLCLEHTDLWRSMLLLGFCRAGNEERTHEQLSAIIGLDVLGCEKKHLQKAKKARESTRKRLSGEKAKRRRHEAKALKDRIMQKEDAKKRHKSAKVSVKKSAKCGEKKKSGGSKCKLCGHQGHNRSTCTVPPADAVDKAAALLDWDELTPKVTRKLTGKDFKPVLIDWS